MPTNFNRSPYFDDFSESDNFYRLLFQPGRAVQARELTQIQTYLQSQISRFGEHVFKDGSLVMGGELSYDSTHTKWLAVQSQDDQGNPVRFQDIMPGMKISRIETDNTELKGTIVKVIPAEKNDPNTIYFKWDSSGPEQEGGMGFGSNETLMIYSDRGSILHRVTTLPRNVTTGAVHYGTSSQLTVSPGIYFWNGIFIKTSGGGLQISKYTDMATYIIGYAINEHIIRDDPRTLDPSSGTSNYGAPGADRYNIGTVLTKVGEGLIFDERILQDFIEIARIDNGNLITAPADQHIYNIIGDTLARRTYEESGNYTSERYSIDLQNKTTTDNPNLVARLSDGVSYVKGHRRSLSRMNAFDVLKGRDVLNESVAVSTQYGDNKILIYDRANTQLAAHPENANGVFVVGSDASQIGGSDAFGHRGAAVAVHCVPQELVKNHSLTDQWKWNSTRVGTIRPIQMLYDKTASDLSHTSGRKGDVYSLWAGDFKSSPISNTVGTTNIIENVSAYANATHQVYHFAQQTHGITANDRISVTGAASSDWNIDFTSANNANITAVVVSGTTGVAAPEEESLTILRTTGNTNPYSTVALDEYTSAAWNGSYIGATIKVGNNVPRKIVDYVGTDSAAETSYNQRYGWSKRGMAILDGEFNEDIPTYGMSYTLNLTMKQARSLVYNSNIDATTGADQYPATLNQMWDVDPISGVSGGDVGKLTDDVYGNRIDGDCTYNFNQGLGGEDALLFSTGRAATRSVVTHGELDAGQTSNTVLYYMEQLGETAGDSSQNLDFRTHGTLANYKFFNSTAPSLYPYSNGSLAADKIKENFILFNKTNGEVLTSWITTLELTAPTYTVTLRAGKAFAPGQTYVLIAPAQAKFVTPAYKKLITGNTTNSITAPADKDLTDLTRGQVLSANATHGSLQAGSRISLKTPDAFKLRNVFHLIDNDNANTDLVDGGAKDITDRFELDSGQRDMFYDNASIILKPGADAPAGNVFVSFDYFQRMDGPKSDLTRSENLTSPSYFAVDSYQYTTDLVFSEFSGTPFAAGQKITSNSGSGYVQAFSNTTSGAFAKLQLVDTQGTFAVNDFAIRGTGAGKIKTVTTADLKYSDIPIYTSKGKVAYPLRNVIDTRSYVTGAGRTSDTISNSIMPILPTSRNVKAGLPRIAPSVGGLTTMAADITMDHFAGRIDKVVVTKDGNYTTIPGIPSVDPRPPKDSINDDSLTLFTLNIPPYTFNPRDVDIVQSLALRHTMKDIGRLAKRVENLEYYVSLNALENAASDMDVTFADGTTRFKNGILVDNFTGHGVVDLGNPDNQSAMGKGVLRPNQDSLAGSLMFAIVPSSAPGSQTTLDVLVGDEITGIQGSGKSPLISMLPYTTETLAIQPVATTRESVNPYDVQNFTGDLTLTPDYDRWIDVETAPGYTVNIRTGNQQTPLIEIDENSDVDEIARTLLGMDEFWSDILGTSGSIGDDIDGNILVSSRNEDGSYDHTVQERNITLGTVNDQYFNTAQIDAAIAATGFVGDNGMVMGMEILPFIRSRDIVVDAFGLKPNHMAAMFFDGTGVEGTFSRATEIYMKVTSGIFSPDATDESEGYEKILLNTGDGVTANAILLAVRGPRRMDAILDGYSVGYIVPDNTKEDTTGKIDWATYKDGFYTTAWNNKIAAHGFQGTDGARTITGYDSEAVATLLPTGGNDDYYNGHYTGTARNIDSANVSHLLLSPDAHRYVPNNFGNGLLAAYTGTPKETIIRFVSGAGAGQTIIANTMMSHTEGQASPVIELQGTLATGINSSTVYTILTRPVEPSYRGQGITQLGSTTARTNKYGERYGILHLPSGARSQWQYGRKLVEVMDRYSRDEWMISSYASAYYFAEGTKEIEPGTAAVLERLQDIRSRLNAYRIDPTSDTPDTLGYIPATNMGGIEGKLAVVTGVNITNGMFTATATDGVVFIPGDTDFGEGDNTTTDPFGNIDFDININFEGDIIFNVPGPGPGSV